LKNKVLIITYYWPPAGGPGVQRWLKFVQYFKQNGIQPVLYIPENPNYPIHDFSLNNKIDPDLEIIRRPIFEFSSLFKKNKYINNIRRGYVPAPKNQSILNKILFFFRGNLIIPDMKIFWRKTSVHFLKNFLIKNNIKTIITTGPPHSLHLIGYDLKSMLDIKWIADFRDPWVNLNYLNRFHLLPNIKKTHQKLRDNVLKKANAVVVTSDKLKTLFDLISKNNYTITNGYDYIYKEKQLDKFFSITHIGSIYPERNPKLLWDVLEKLCDDIKGFKDDLKLNFIGNVNNGFKKKMSLKSYSDCIIYYGYIEYGNTIDFLCKSQLLLMIESDEIGSSFAIPGKFFDYINSRRPVLALGPIDSEISKIINKTNTGHFSEYKDFDGLFNYVLSTYKNFKKETNYIVPVDIKKYSRVELTKEYAKLINTL
tara:strand:+ start:4009 stop:5283 length:1275 start_codon:yes stop_codon:yes gene_type:complete